MQVCSPALSTRKDRTRWTESFTGREEVGTKQCNPGVPAIVLYLVSSCGIQSAVAKHWKASAGRSIMFPSVILGGVVSTCLVRTNNPQMPGHTFGVEHIIVFVFFKLHTRSFRFSTMFVPSSHFCILKVHINFIRHLLIDIFTAQHAIMPTMPNPSEP